MKQLTKEQLENLPINELLNYFRARKLHNAKVDHFIMGFCLGGCLCTVLMFARWAW